MKIVKLTGLVLLSSISIAVIFLFETKNWPAGSSLSGIVLGFSLPVQYSAERCEDFASDGVTVSA